MVDYRKRLVDMTPEEKAEVAPAADNFSKVFGDRTEEPMSVTAADTAVSLATPVDSVVEVQKELQKEEPDYLKIGMLAGVEALGSIPALGPVAKSMIRKGADLSKQTDTAIESTTNIPPVPKKEASPFDVEYDYDLTLKMEDMIDEWARGNVSNADLRKNLATLDIKLPYRIGPKADPSSLDIQMPDGTIYKGTGDVPSKPRPLTLDATSDAVDDLGFSEKDLSDWKAANYAKDKFRIPPDDEMAAAATNLREGKITSEEFRKLSDERQPIKPITEMPKFPTKEEVVKALHSTDPRKTKKGVLGVNKSIEDNTLISSRLDIPAYNNSDTWVVSLHDGSVKDGKTVGYGQSAVLNNVSFTSNPLAASKIATGSAKTTIARMQGEWQNMDPEEVYNTVENLFDDPEWVQVGMNPYRASYFYDKADGMPVISAEQVMQVGPLVFAKKAKKTTPDDPRFEFENKVTGVKANFNEGGMAMNEQMEMAFALGGSVEEVDPVSGNEVPPGSLPEEVRDDIDANLSEGEYVVPADVVRYYGVKFFEDLRTQAKMGFEDMAANGRIGGQPVPEENPLPFDVSELQVEEEPVQMNEGGFLDRDALEAKFPASFMGSGSPAQEWKTFENETGLTITIRYVNGQPMSPIPAGYTEVGARSEEALEAPKSTRDSDDPIFPQDQGEQTKVDLTSLTTDELEKLGDGTADAGILEKIASYGLPLAGTAMRLGREMKAADVNAEIISRLKSGTNLDGSPLTPEDRAKLGKIFDMTVDTEESGSGIFGGQRSLTEGLQDTSGDEQVGFADTFLGDLLGFDGQPGIQATDKDGNKLGLGASISGGRRKPVVKPAVGSGGNDGGDNDSSQPGPNFDGSAINSVTGTSWSDPDKTSDELPETGGGDRGMNKGGLASKKKKKK